MYVYHVYTPVDIVLRTYFVFTLAFYSRTTSVAVKNDFSVSVQTHSTFTVYGGKGRLKPSRH